jgi:hypothetical protein
MMKETVAAQRAPGKDSNKAYDNNHCWTFTG